MGNNNSQEMYKIGLEDGVARCQTNLNKTVSDLLNNFKDDRKEFSLGYLSALKDVLEKMPED